MVKKINICIDFNKIAPLDRWHHDSFTDNFFGDDVFNLVKWDEFKQEENNFLFLYCVPDETTEFLQSRTRNFFNTLKHQRIKILFWNEQFNLFMHNGDIFKHDYSVKNYCYDINNILYWKIANIFKSHDIGEEMLYFIHSAKGFLDEIEQMKKRKILWINSTLDIKSKHIQTNDFLMWASNQQIPEEKEFRYHYACLFAGRPARHRHYLLKKLWNNNLLDFGKCSLKPHPDPTDTSEFNSIDLPAHGSTNSHLNSQNETEIFKDVFIWIAGETYCPNGYPYFTEKTVKPIMYKRPFISYGNPGTLAYLRDYGFKTFGNFWDESYDDEKDDDKKIDMIANIIENICGKNLSELDQMYSEMEPILTFNKNLLTQTDWRKDLVEFLS
jgi:hypothetical protein